MWKFISASKMFTPVDSVDTTLRKRFSVGHYPNVCAENERRKIELCNDLPHKLGEAHICLIISGLDCENDVDSTL